MAFGKFENKFFKKTRFLFGKILKKGLERQISLNVRQENTGKAEID